MSFLVTILFMLLFRADVFVAFHILVLYLVLYFIDSRTT
jgi:hypothetical protein